MSTVITVSRETTPAFGVFVGLYNKINNTSFSVKSALADSELVELFKATTQSLKTNTTTDSSKSQAKSSSTKKLSYDAFQNSHGTTVAHLIYKLLKTSKKPMSRTEIAQELNIRISTVCGQVYKLMEAGLCKVAGTKIDSESEMKVETLTFL